MSLARISRRTVLRGLGASVALPLLDAMLPRRAWAATAAGQSVAPTRMAFLYVPNGVHMPDWKPQREGAEFELPPTLQLLEPFRDDMLVLSGLTHDKAYPNGDGPGDHARALATFLTGCQARKTGGADIRVGVSVDQVAAQRVGSLTKLPSLEIGCEAGRQSGECDSGYSCSYSANISWRTESLPMPKEVKPRAVFERLFGSRAIDANDPAVRQRMHDRKSILDYVLDDAQRLQGRLGRGDARKIDEYLTAVRDVERRIGATEHELDELPELELPDGVPREYAEHLRLMADLLALAFQTDTTRIATFVLANEGSNRSYPWLEVRDGHHDLSHHGRNEEKQAKLAKINRFHMEQFAYLLGKLKAIREGEGTLLDHSMIAYGSGIGDGDRHNHNDLPIVLLGRGGGTIKPGRHLQFSRKTPVANLWLSMLDRMEAPTDQLGDSTGRLKGLDG